MPRTARDSLPSAQSAKTTVQPILQPDVFSTIILFCDNHALIQLSLVCRALDYQVIPSLYRQVTIDFQRGKITLPRAITDDRYPFASVQKENDTAFITPRFAAALRYTRILLIRGHLRDKCQARYFTHGLPTQMIEALENVHTVRLFTLRDSHMVTTIAGLCDVGGPEVCHLVHLLRNRYTIYSRPPNGFGVITRRKTSNLSHQTVYDYSPPISAVANIPGKGQILVHPSHVSKGNWTKHNLPLTVFHAPITVIIQLPTEDPYISNLSDYAKSVILSAYFLVSPSHPGICIVCPDEILQYMQEAKAGFIRTTLNTVGPDTSRRIMGAGQMRRRYLENVQVLSLNQIGREPWYEALKGQEVHDWY